MTEYQKLVVKEYICDCIKWCIFIVGCVVVVGGICYLLNRIDRKECYSRYAEFQPEYVGAITGCMITVDDQRIPADALRMTI